MEPLTPDQARAFLGHVRGDSFEALYWVAISMGLRQGEILGLRWDDIDLSAEELSVRYALQRVDGKLQLVDPKTEFSRRTLAIPAAVVRQLREHRAGQNRARLLTGGEWNSAGFVFTSSKGTPLDGCNVTRRFERLLKAAELPRQRFHDLRHACASFLLAQDMDMHQVKSTLGHSQVSLTIDTYAHMMPSKRREAAHMDELLAGEA